MVTGRKGPFRKAEEAWNRLKERVGTPWLFLLAALGITAVTALLSPETAALSIATAIGILASTWLTILVVFLLLFLFSLLPTRKVRLWLGAAKGWRGWAVAVIGGVLSSGPIYLWYPLLADLRQEGLRNAHIATFLYTRAVKPPLLPLMVLYFGIAFTVILTAYTILFSLLNGLLVEQGLRLLTERRGGETKTGVEL